MAASDGASLQSSNASINRVFNFLSPTAGAAQLPDAPKFFPARSDTGRRCQDCFDHGFGRWTRARKETWESHRQPTTLGRGSFCQLSSVTSKGTSTLLLLSLSSKLACFSSAHDLSALDACTFCELISGCLQSQTSSRTTTPVAFPFCTLCLIVLCVHDSKGDHVSLPFPSVSLQYLQLITSKWKSNRDAKEHGCKMQTSSRVCCWRMYKYHLQLKPRYHRSSTRNLGPYHVRKCHFRHQSSPSTAHLAFRSWEEILLLRNPGPSEGHRLKSRR